MKRFSKKRQSILDCLKNTDTHPSAEWVYNKLKPIYPDLSLATVYRNIKELVAEGKVDSLGTICEKEHFDGITTPHCHAVCVKCGKIIDINDLALSSKDLERAKKIKDFNFLSASIQLMGVCSSCLEKEKLKND